MTEKIPDVFEPLWTGESVFCKCGHHVNMHSTKPISNNDNYIDSICRFDNGYFVCPCTGFESKITERIKKMGNDVDTVIFSQGRSTKIDIFLTK